MPTGRHPLAIWALSVVVACSLLACDNQAEVQKNFEVAKAHLAKRGYEPALSAFNKVLELEPFHREARLLKSEVLYNMVRLEEAAEVLTALRAETPDDARVTLGLGYIRKDQARHDEAIVLFESLPEAVRPELAMVEVLAAVRRADEAMDILARILVENPWHERAYYLLSRVEGRRGRTGEAQMWGEFHRATSKRMAPLGDAANIEKQGRTLEARMLRAHVYAEVGWYHESSKILADLVEVAPTNSATFVIMGRVLSALGQTPSAVRAFEEALKHSPDEQSIKTRLEAEKAVAAKGPPEDPLEVARKSFATEAGDEAAASKKARARAIALYISKRDPKNVVALRLVGRFFDRPEDAFVRLWAFKQASVLEPKAKDLNERIQAECVKLAVRPEKLTKN